MKDYFELGPTPCDEECSQVGTDNFTKENIRECRIFQRQLERVFPDARFMVKSFPHDFGTYREVIVMYDDENEKEYALALEVEGNVPMNWDEKAKEELAQKEEL